MYDDVPTGVMLAQIDTEDAFLDLVREVQRRIELEFIIWGITI